MRKFFVSLLMVGSTLGFSATDINVEFDAPYRNGGGGYRMVDGGKGIMAIGYYDPSQYFDVASKNETKMPEFANFSDRDVYTFGDQFCYLAQERRHYEYAKRSINCYLRSGDTVKEMSSTFIDEGEYYDRPNNFIVQMGQSLVLIDKYEKTYLTFDFTAKKVSAPIAFAGLEKKESIQKVQTIQYKGKQAFALITTGTEKWHSVHVVDNATMKVVKSLTSADLKIKPATVWSRVVIGMGQPFARLPNVSQDGTRAIFCNQQECHLVNFETDRKVYKLPVKGTNNEKAIFSADNRFVFIQDTRLFSKKVSFKVVEVTTGRVKSRTSVEVGKPVLNLANYGASKDQYLLVMWSDVLVFDKNGKTVKHIEITKSPILHEAVLVGDKLKVVTASGVLGTVQL